MPSLKDLRARIRSVKNTRQITKTMKMVAAAKVRKARQACEDARPYAIHLGRVMSNLASTVSGTGPALLVGRSEVKTVRLIVCGADRGLCGAFNANIEKKLYADVHRLQAEGKFVQIVALGRKVRDYAKRHFPKQFHAGQEIGRADLFDLAETTANEAIEAFTNGACDAVHLVFVECVSMLTQTPRAAQLVPFQIADQQDPMTSIISQPEYEPSEEEILAELLPRNIRLQVFRGLLESAASEHAARMNAMDNASRNATDMIKGLTLQYNRSRQAAITKELIEIISGAEAL